MLGVDLTHTAGNGHPGGTSEPVDLSRYPRVQAAIDRNTGDRSADQFRIIAACITAGLVLAQARWAVAQRPDLVERLQERRDDDVLVCWLKVIDVRQQRQHVGDHHGGDDDPIPLTRTVPIPPFPTDALPGPIADMVTALAEATQTDPGMPGTSALSVLSACTGGHAVIEIRPGWREPLNAYLTTIAESGERKSSVQRAMVAPILAAERQLVGKGEGERLEAETRKQVATKAAEKQRNTAAAAAGKDEWDKAMADAIGAAMIADAIVVPPIPRLVADDITPEAAASLLAEQGGRLAIVSAEGGVFDIIAGRYTRSLANMDVFLKGHPGDELRVDRKGRPPPPEYVPRPALTLGLMIQPAVLAAIAANRKFRGRGLRPGSCTRGRRRRSGAARSGRRSPTPRPAAMRLRSASSSWAWSIGRATPRC